MRTLTSLCRFESQFLHALCKRNTNHARIFCKYKTTNPDAPRNIFELYSKNSHWMGVYERNPLKNEPLTKDYIDERVQIEKERNISVDLNDFVDPKNAVWTPETIRVGAIGKKLGCSSLWTKEGMRHAVTLIQIDDCHVMDTLISRADGGKDKENRLILGAGKLSDDKKLATFSREKIEWFEERGICPPEYWAGFEVSKDGLLLPGTQIKASHFVPGQFLQVIGISIKRGMQGVMKRWGMKGQPATHGQSKTHRKMGATGGGQDPGRVFPGKKMAGHVGGRHRTTQAIKLFRVDRKLNVIFVKGYIPGEKNSYVLIKDYPTCKTFPVDSLPYPTRCEEDEADLEEDMYAEKVARPTDPSLEFPPFKL